MTIDTSRQGEVRLALAWPQAHRRSDTVITYDTGMLPTFTDALMRFQADIGIPLHTLDGAMAIAGANTGTTISISRSRWTISTSGLAAMFRRPPTIINDVAARAWALRDPATRTRLLRGSGSPDLDQAGRYVMVMLDQGVGCATIDIDAEGRPRILEAEAGHMDFAPADATEMRLAASFRQSTPVSWEQILMLDRNDPQMVAATPEMSDAQRTQFVAGLAGRFAVNMILATGAWKGALLTGARAARILPPDALSAFDAAFLHRQSFRRVVAATSCWMIEQPDPVLTGLAALVAGRQPPDQSG